MYDDTNVQHIMVSIKERVPVPDARRLILFMHFHKCGGSSIVNIFKRNNLQGYPINSNGNPKHEDRSLIEFWRFDKNKLSNFASNALKLDTRFIALEWNYFVSHFVTDGFFLNDLFKQVICFREPLKRYISVLKHDEYQHKIYNYEQFKHIDLMWKRKDTDKTFFINYNKDNYYVAMLNGLGDRKQSGERASIRQEHLDKAKLILRRFFDAILILEDKQSFILLEKYGITNALDAERLKVNNGENMKIIVDEEAFRRNNKYDYELYEYLAS